MTYTAENITPKGQWELTKTRTILTGNPLLGLISAADVSLVII